MGGGVGRRRPRPARPRRGIRANGAVERRRMLVNRDGPATQPGSRSYSRSWIRDGALTSAARCVWGTTTSRAAPGGSRRSSSTTERCRGARTVAAGTRPENDSHGENHDLAASTTGSRATARRSRAVWPHLAKAAAYIDTLRAKRRTPEYSPAATSRPSLSRGGTLGRRIRHPPDPAPASNRGKAPAPA